MQSVFSGGSTPLPRSSTPCPCCGEVLNQGTRGLFLNEGERPVDTWRRAAWKTCSTCSTLAKKHVFLPWPTAFGVEGTRILGGEELPENNCSLHRTQKTGVNRKFPRRECSTSGVVDPSSAKVPSARAPVVRRPPGSRSEKDDEETWSDADIGALIRALVALPLAALGTEGHRKLVEHFRIERSLRTREDFLAERRRDRNLECDGCGGDLGKRYGSSYSEVVEVHHRVPLWKGAQIPQSSKLALLCPTCHRVVHYRREEPMSVEELRLTIAASSATR